MIKPNQGDRLVRKDMTVAERTERIHKMFKKGTAGQRTIADDNIVDIDFLIAEVIRIEDLFFIFKTTAMNKEALESTLDAAECGFTDKQLYQSMMTLIECVGDLDDLEKQAMKSVMAIATINAILKKQTELTELKGAIA